MLPGNAVRVATPLAPMTVERGSAIGTESSLKSPAQHFGGGVGVQAGQLAAADIELVEREEPECLVPAVVHLRKHHRTAQREAPFVLNAKRLRRREKSARVEVLVVVECESGAVQLVRAGLHRETGDAGERVRVLGRVVVRHQLEFGDRIHRGIHFGIIGEVAARERNAVEIDLIVE